MHHSPTVSENTELLQLLPCPKGECGKAEQIVSGGPSYCGRAGDSKGLMTGTVIWRAPGLASLNHAQYILTSCQNFWSNVMPGPV